MAIITDSCDKLLDCLNEDISREDFFNKCVKKRLLDMYYREDSEYDSLIKKMEVSIDYNDFYAVKRCVTKMMRALSKNRNNLIATIERLVSN